MRTSHPQNPLPDEAERAEKAGAEVLELCVAAGGCLTGEHGVGIEKRDLMRVQFNEAQLEDVSGFGKEIDHALERIAAIEKHLGIENKLAA
jgi:FAD/FMN-containing dehydrogenase